MNMDNNSNRFSVLDSDDIDTNNTADIEDNEIKHKTDQQSPQVPVPVPVSRTEEMEETEEPKEQEEREEFDYDKEHYNKNKFKYGFKQRYKFRRYETRQEEESIDDNKIDKNNIKKMLCFNMLNKKDCNYGNKCMYAHNLEEQKKEPMRKEAYDIILDKKDLSDIDLVINRDLYHVLVQLSRTCSYCNKGVCTGGYNCKYGAIRTSYQICYDDLTDGRCQKVNCPNVHLTKKGLVPYSKQKLNRRMENDKNKQLYSTIVQTGVSKKDKDKEKEKEKITDVPLGTLLNDTFFLKKIKKMDYDSDSEQSDDSVEKIRNYLNQDSDDSCDESIFSVGNDLKDIINKKN